MKSKFNTSYKIKLKLKSFIYKKIGLVRRKLETKTYFGKTLQLIQGSVYTQVEEDMVWLQKYASNSSRIFDIGVNTGQSTYMFLSLENVKEVILVEPDAVSLSITHENLIRNKLIHKTRTINAFASNESNTTIEFWSFYGDASGSFSPKQAGTANFAKSSMMVPTITLDEVYTLFEAPPDLIKVDVEGAELMVLKGSVKIAQMQKALFFIEMHIFEGNSLQTGFEQLLDWCNQNQYEVFNPQSEKPFDIAAIPTNTLRYHVLLKPKTQLRL